MSLFDLSGKVTIVTGAGRGIGKSIALGMAEAGSNIVLCSRTESELEQVAEEINGRGADVFAVPCDVTKREDIQRVVDLTVERFERIDTLINNAGMTIKMPAVDFTLEDWNKVLSINLTGAFLFAQAVGKQMIKQKQGKIINISSIAAETALTGSVAYCASKGGVDMVTKVLAVEWAKYGINVNGIAPAYIETPLVEAVKETRSGFEERVKERTPLGRLGSPEEIVGAAIYLASDCSSYVTGETIKVDGGWTALGL
ncbi:hypothetical protein DCC39_09400 [Pueribacillus theae]|uniref:Ketoreductase domain-containing protein n=1 Tax=Pueribacillus theae TaxID=2171751 RepID=A0A2U1K1Z3_9BACI|nr:glucose 1-dehydrogenase [Pueribacillus theae]PWA11179.1 hypothetical protein DCC39_09400 [Pueribacillus theae]